MTIVFKNYNYNIITARSVPAEWHIGSKHALVDVRGIERTVHDMYAWVDKNSSGKWGVIPVESSNDMDYEIYFEKEEDAVQYKMRYM